jgi:hypothetical protein
MLLGHSLLIRPSTLTLDEGRRTKDENEDERPREPERRDGADELSHETDLETRKERRTA